MVSTADRAATASRNLWLASAVIDNGLWPGALCLEVSSALGCTHLNSTVSAKLVQMTVLILGVLFHDNHLS